MIKVDDRYLLIQDAQLLMRQYNNRNTPSLEMSMEQRKAWASEMVAVMDELVEALRATDPSQLDYTMDRICAWNAAMREGRRIATIKIRPGPPYGGIKLREPEFKDDPTDPRGRDPRYLRKP